MYGSLGVLFLSFRLYMVYIFCVVLSELQYHEKYTKLRRRRRKSYVKVLLNPHPSLALIYSCSSIADSQKQLISVTFYSAIRRIYRTFLKANKFLIRRCLRSLFRTFFFLHFFVETPGDLYWQIVTPFCCPSCHVLVHVFVIGHCSCVAHTFKITNHSKYIRNCILFVLFFWINPSWFVCDIFSPD